MKKIKFLLILFSFSVFGQTTETIVDSSFTIEDAGYNKAEFTRIIKNKKTSKIFYFFFQNSQYNHITDIGSIAIYDRSTLVLFYKKLEQFANVESGKNVRYESKYFTLIRYDFTDNIYLESKDGKTFIIPNTGNQQGAIDLANFLIRNENFFPKTITKKK